MFDNRYGTGQSTIDGIIRATDMLIAGKPSSSPATAGAARGVAMRARGMGAEVIVTEIDPDQGARSRDGRLPSSCRWNEAAPVGDMFVTVTGNMHVIRRRAFHKS